MTRTLSVLLVALVVGRPLSGAIVSGVAAGQGDERCAAFGGHALAAGDAVTLISPQVPSWTAVVTVEREIADCAQLIEATIEGPYYELSVPAGVDDATWVAIAVPGTPPLEQTAAGFTAELDGGAPRESFAVCTSTEGLHLTIWSGPRITGRRRAHTYVYLGYDVEPTCSDAEADRPRLEKN